MGGLDTLGLILAGGRGTRMGGVDKAFLRVGNETLIERGIARAQPQVSELLINANGDASRFAKFGPPVIADSVSGFLGPLAGILSGLDWMRTNRPNLQWLATFACDCPFFPRDMVEQLLQKAAADSASIAVAGSGDRHHPVFAIWNATLPVTAKVLREGEGPRKMHDFVASFPNTTFVFPSEPIDPFFNVNTPDDLAHAEELSSAY